MAYDEFQPSWEEEGLFARDLDGQLIRDVEATESDYEKKIIVTIDGEKIEVPKAVPTTDPQGKYVYLDASGRTKPRPTTIYDAALRLWLQRRKREIGELQSDLSAAVMDVKPKAMQSARDELLKQIPTLCHRDHLPPVGVCRVCSVQVKKQKRGKDGKLLFTKDGKPDLKDTGKLVPACVQPVDEDMFVITLANPDPQEGQRVRQSVRVLLELLAADHLPQQNEDDELLTLSDEERTGEPNDFVKLLETLSNKVGCEEEEVQARGGWLTPDRFAPDQPWSLRRDETSPVINYDPNACILCDRCVRACSDIKHNYVIGRTGKGYTTRIGFDLNDPMGESSCVECGECMLTCPTDALTFKEPVEKSEWFLEQTAGVDPAAASDPQAFGKFPVSPDEKTNNVLLETLDPRIREWNQFSVIRWRLRAGGVLCTKGEFGATAFLLQSGTFEVLALDANKEPFLLTPKDLILGEMTCLNNAPRSRTVRAKTDVEVFEIRRNLLFALQRVPEAREQLMAEYRKRVVNSFVNNVDWFKNVPAEDKEQVRRFLLSRWDQPAPDPDSKSKRRLVEFLELQPKQVVCQQGDKCDGFYVVRLGHVQVKSREEGVIDYIRPIQEFDKPRSADGHAGMPGSQRQAYFGEIACLADWPELADLLSSEEERQGRRTATCTALDHVELVRIHPQCLRELLEAVPALKTEVLRIARVRLQKNRPRARLVPGGNSAPELASGRPPAPPAPLRRAFTEQGLYNAQRLLVLDLEACTRCDECTKACSDTHQGITRLVREGLRVDKWLVASSCRSCSDPYCLVGCPVDSIHRDGAGLHIQIEDHCIGCGLCANNCPYGNINMHPLPKKHKAELQYTATTCDLCSSVPGVNDWRKVSCVFACPHNAAFRMTGDELWGQLEASGGTS